MFVKGWNVCTMYKCLFGLFDRWNHTPGKNLQLQNIKEKYLQCVIRHSFTQCSKKNHKLKTNVSQEYSSVAVV